MTRETFFPVHLKAVVQIGEWERQSENSCD